MNSSSYGGVLITLFQLATQKALLEQGRRPRGTVGAGLVFIRKVVKDFVQVSIGSPYTTVELNSYEISIRIEFVSIGSFFAQSCNSL